MVSHSFAVPAWSTVLDCLSWSDDSEIAIAAAEVVELLMPKLIIASLKQETEEAQWHRVRVQVNLFNEVELPYFEPLGFHAFSIGEEQSQGTVKSLAWSPAGLAKHRRCALAILGTNHVLSLWASDYNPREARSWSRVFIFNRVLQQFFEGESAPSELDGMKYEEMLRLRSRIRSFAWCPRPTSLIMRSSNVPSAIDQTDGFHYLAVTNDLNEIVILEVLSPFKKLITTPSAPWNARVCTFLSLSNQVVPSNMSASSLPGLSCSSRFVDQVAWSRWTQSPAGARPNMSSVLAYTSGGRLSLELCHLGLDQGEAILTLVRGDTTVTGDHIGPLKWLAPNVEDKLYLLSFTQDEILCVEASTQPASDSVWEPAVTRQKRSHEWDQIAGAAVAVSSTGESKLNFASHAVHENDCSGLLNWPLGNHSVIQGAAWNVQVAKHRIYFSAEHKLSGRVTTRTWGIAASPFSDYLAVCYSLVPKDMLVYAMSADQVSNIVISSDSIDLPVFLNNPDQVADQSDISFESILFSIARWIRRNTAEKTLNTKRMDALWRCLDQTVKDSTMSLATLDDIHASKSLSEAAERLKSYLNLYESFAAFVRYEVLALQPELESFQESNIANSVSWRLCVGILALPLHLYAQTLCSKKLLYMYNQWQRLLINQHPDQFQETRDATPNDLVLDSSEPCEICEAEITFANSQWARCTNGHEFVRCGLTFLAIQAPGISKFCGLCNRQYLTNQHLITLDAAEGEIENTSAKPDHSLIQLLLVALDICIYCGGKFVG